jgi:hypothetical protein
VSTNLVKAALTWTLWNNSKSVEFVITKVVPNFTFFLHKFSGNFYQPMPIFAALETILNLFLFWNLCHVGPTCQNPISTWCPGHASSSTRPLPPAARAGIQLGRTALVRRMPPEVLSETLHRRSPHPPPSRAQDHWALIIEELAPRAAWSRPRDHSLLATSASTWATFAGHLL